MTNRMQSHMFWLLPIYLIVGYIYPIVGFAALICMLAPIVWAAARGRYWCGNWCPRGSFYDSVMAKLSPNKPIPAVLRHPWFRAFMVAFIMGVFTVQMISAWGDLNAMGMVFVRIIFVTTVVGIVLAVTVHQRAWCTFCPMGTIASFISAKTAPKPLMVEASCVSCKLCTKACPLQLKPYEAKGNDAGFSDADCLKCGRCIDVCPKKALHF